MPEPRSETIRRAQAGDEAAIATLVAEQQRYVYSIAMSITRNPTDAADYCPSGAGRGSAASFLDSFSTI